MPFNTFTVASAVTPSVIETYFSHYLNRGPLKQKPSAHISYHEGLKIVRQFLDYSSKHTVEDIQGFTAQWVPAPTWVRTQDVEVPPQFLERAARILRSELGSQGIHKIGGETWWQWRRPEHPLHAEWIEMKKDYTDRRRTGVKCDRVILYVHGGAYYFGSVDEHRYQMQRHARKLKARVLAPRYRLAPQFPFPCGLYDCIATYFYLLEHFDPTQILFAGDSAGGGMVLSMLVTLRDQGCPLPAGTLLLSPWVDLTHSFPSVSGNGVGDYIPPHGFLHKPSLSWPPPPAEKQERKFTQPVEQPFDVVELPANPGLDMKATPSAKRNVDDARENPPTGSERKMSEVSRNAVPGLGSKLEILIDGKLIEITEQIQLYAKNDLLAHPLVSPVQQPSLGGLPPMLIQVGGAELLRDEQIYLAHKAANPMAYPPSDAILDEYDPQRSMLNRYPPTDVQLQVWEDLCHVPHTLSFTRPAKYMYRSVAQFGAWALARAQKKDIEIQDDDAVSIISSGSETGSINGSTTDLPRQKAGSIGMGEVISSQDKPDSIGAVGKAGDELPPFKDHMIRQRVDRHGLIYPLPVQSAIATLHLDPATIGAIKPGPVSKWLNKHAEYSTKFANQDKKVQKKRVKEAGSGYDKIKGESPPPSALVNRLHRGVPPEAKKKGKSWGLAMWSGWGSSHDQSTLEREEKATENASGREGVTTSDPNAGRNGSLAFSTADESVNTGEASASTPNLAVPKDATKKARRTSAASAFSTARSQKDRETSRPKSSYRKVTDAGQVENDHSIAVSPVDQSHNPLVGSSGLHSVVGVSRQSSMTSAARTFTSRPVSIAAPIPVNQQGVDGHKQAPDMSDTNKAAVKVPGSENTFLNPTNPRPHNGTVAYPFKLKQGQGPTGLAASRNPSTQTLTGSLASADVEGASTDEARAGSTNRTAVEMAARETAAVELSTGAESAGKGSNANPAELSSAPGRRRADPAPASASAAANTRGAIVPPGALSASGEDSLVSPLEAPPRSILGAFESRDSRLGSLGADGMPNAAFPSRAPPPAPMPTTQTAVNGFHNVGEDDLVSPVEESDKSTPFKLRNPVFDARVESTTASPPAPTQSTDADGKSAPFKLRHTIYDPKIAPIGSKPPGEAITTPAAPEMNEPDSFTTEPAFHAISADPEPSPSISDFPIPASVPPHTNVTMPTVVTKRPVTVPDDDVDADDDDFDDLPPPPPPKDSPPKPPGTANGASPLRKSPLPPILKSAPSIGDFDFERGNTNGLEKPEKARPLLETFVTASEGFGLKDVK